MAHYDCSTHGRVHSVGKKPTYCPICGKKVVAVWLIPKVYVETEVVSNGFWLSVVGGMAYLLILSRVSRVATRKNEPMPPTRRRRSMP